MNRGELNSEGCDGNSAVLHKVSCIELRFFSKIGSTELLNLRPVVAMCRGLLDHFVATANLDLTLMKGGGDPPTLRAITAAKQLVEIVDRLVGLDAKMGDVPRSEFERFKYAIGASIVKFVPADQLDDCRRYRERLLAEYREPLPGPGPADRGRA